MSTSTPDSVLDDILAAAKLLSVSDGSPPPLPGVARAVPVLLHTGGVVSEGAVPIESFSVIDIDCLDVTFCFGAMYDRDSFCIKRNCTAKIHASSEMSFAGRSDSFVFICRNIPGSVFVEPKRLTSWESKTLSTTEWSREF